MRRDPILERIFSIRLTVKRVSEATGITTAGVAQWKRVPRWHVDAVSKVTGVPPYELRPDLYPSPPREAA